MKKAWFYRLCCHDPRHKHCPRQAGDNMQARGQRFRVCPAVSLFTNRSCRRAVITSILATILLGLFSWSRSKLPDVSRHVSHGDGDTAGEHHGQGQELVADGTIFPHPPPAVRIERPKRPLTAPPLPDTINCSLAAPIVPSGSPHSIPRPFTEGFTLADRTCDRISPPVNDVPSFLPETGLQPAGSNQTLADLFERQFRKRKTGMGLLKLWAMR